MTLFKKRLKIFISEINKILFLLVNKEFYYTEQPLVHVLVFVLVNFLDLLSLQYLACAKEQSSQKFTIVIKNFFTLDTMSSLSTIFTVFFAEECPVVFRSINVFCSISGLIP